jgi:enoyl-CoA hydratase
MAYENIIYQKKDNVATITLNRPKRLNALNEKMMGEMIEALDQIARDDEVRSVILTGGGKLFGAGADIEYISEIKSSVNAHNFFPTKATPLYRKLYELPKVVIAAVSGVALGGCFELVMCCDLRIASDTATFGMPEITLGVMPGGGGTQLLCRLVGLAKGKEMLFTGKTIDAQEALRIGLVNRVVPVESLEEESRKLAIELAAKPQFALRMIKLAANMNFELSLRAGLEYEARLFEMTFSTKDYVEGTTAFMEKRKPRFNDS